MAFFLGRILRNDSTISSTQYYIRFDPFEGYILTDYIEDATPFMINEDAQKVREFLTDNFDVEVVEHNLEEVSEPVYETKYTLKYIADWHDDLMYFHPNAGWTSDILPALKGGASR